jgi:hypothetical protein
MSDKRSEIVQCHHTEIGVADRIGLSTERPVGAMHRWCEASRATTSSQIAPVT